MFFPPSLLVSVSPALYPPLLHSAPQAMDSGVASQWAVGARVNALSSQIL